MMKRVHNDRTNVINVVMPWADSRYNDSLRSTWTNSVTGCVGVLLIALLVPVAGLAAYGGLVVLTSRFFEMVQPNPTLLSAIGSIGLPLLILPVAAQFNLHRRDKQIRLAVHEFSGDDLDSLIFGLAEKFDLSKPGLLRILAESLVTKGFQGLTIRLVSDNHPAFVDLPEPFDFPFEPHRLTDLGALESGSEFNNWPHTENQDENAGPSPQERAQRLNIKGHLEVGGGMGLSVLVGIMMLMITGGTVYVLYRWFVGFGVGPWCFWTLLVVIALWLVMLWRKQTQWFIVPGGLVLRRPAHLWSSRVVVHVFNPSNSILIRSDRGCAVADESGGHEIRCLDFAVPKAWLSPVDPPASETLSDLV